MSDPGSHLARVRSLIKALLPPVLLTIYRRLNPPPAMFAGVYASALDIVDQRPWTSAARLQSVAEVIRKAIVSGSGNPLQSEALIPCVLLNLLTFGGRRCSVLDFGGGAGIGYFRIRPYLTCMHAVNWTVVDSEALIELGRTYKRPDDNLTFVSSIPTNGTFDLIYINTVLQYVPEYRDVIASLAALTPRFFVLTRLVAGEIDTYFAQQRNIEGGITYSMFLNVDEVMQAFAAVGYELVHSSYAEEDTWPPCLYRDIPASLQLRNTLNLVFERSARSH